MSPKIHATAGGIALATISTFWVSTAVSEIFANAETVAAVKQAILYGMLVLIPAMMTTGATGAKLGKGWKLPQVTQKSKRMKIIAANGVLILLPSAVFLANRASEGPFDTGFYLIQTLELIAGATNIFLLTLNMRDGLALARRRASKGAKSGHAR